MHYLREYRGESHRKCSVLGAVSIHFVLLESELSISEEPLRLGLRYG